MASKDDKHAMFDRAIAIATEHAKGGSDKATPAYVLKETYKVLIELYDEIEKG